ncbi:MAG: cell division protein ZapA [Acidobacteriota bacterium]
MSRAQMAAQDASAVVVEIYDQVYQLRGPDSAYIERLAALVDSKMRAVTAHGATVDSLRVAVLAALNIADELTSLRARYDSLASGVIPVQPNVSSRAGSLSGMLDALLEDDRTHPHLDRKAG